MALAAGRRRGDHRRGVRPPPLAERLVRARLWLLHSLRLPALINGAFFAGAEERVVPAFYLTAIVVVMINLWMLARAGWDL